MRSQAHRSFFCADWHGAIVIVVVLGQPTYDKGEQAYSEVLLSFGNSETDKSAF